MPINNNGLADGLFQDKDILLSTIFWNADSLTNNTFSEFKHIVIKKDIDLNAIAEVGASTDNEEYFQLSDTKHSSLKDLGLRHQDS